MAKIVRSVRGTRDFYPEEMALRNWLRGHMKAVSEKYGYTEYEAPILETLELYAAKSGDELVKEQSYVFEDRGGDPIVLRPEMTPSLARMIAQRAQALGRPIRWWSFGPFWRYERPQKGRTREFFQWNIDILGADEILADAEICAVGAELFAALGLTPDQVTIQVNDRRLVAESLTAIGVPGERHIDVFRVIDRREKMSPREWVVYGREQGLDDGQIERLRVVLDDRERWRESDALVAFFDAVSQLGLREWFTYEPSLMRGLDYYTGIVFEARDHDGEFRAILGGGHYDNLVADVGGEPIGGVGFGMGDVVVGLVAQKYGVVPDLRGSPTDVLVTVFDEASLPDALELARALRESGLRVELYPTPARLGKQLKYANRHRIPVAAVLGPDERAAGQVALKSLASGEQATVALTEAATEARALIDE